MDYSDSQKKKYYDKRRNDRSLSKKQRDFAKKRSQQLKDSMAKDSYIIMNSPTGGSNGFLYQVSELKQLFRRQYDRWERKGASDKVKMYISEGYKLNRIIEQNNLSLKDKVYLVNYSNRR